MVANALKHMGITLKVSPHLAELLEGAAPHEMLDIVLELEQAEPDAVTRSLDRQQKIAFFKRAFELEAQPVQNVIEMAGGEVLDRAWSSSSMRARVPARSLSALCSMKAVELVDVPHLVERE